MARPPGTAWGSWARGGLSPWPWATFAANLVGSLALGLLYGWLAARTAADAVVSAPRAGPDRPPAEPNRTAADAAGPAPNPRPDRSPSAPSRSAAADAAGPAPNRRPNRPPGQTADRWRAFAGVGLLGGFTTYSAFSVEAVALIGAGAAAIGLAYAAASVAGGITLAWLGLAWGSRIGLDRSAPG
ncbi:MAG: CrcB family protein, partial [Bifidobacteriaceae bacterium]|nr:CrcB family protein [Bifidobacteriaceae bacterium]